VVQQPLSAATPPTITLTYPFDTRPPDSTRIGSCIQSETIHLGHVELRQWHARPSLEARPATRCEAMHANHGERQVERRFRERSILPVTVRPLLSRPLTVQRLAIMHEQPGC
jgi:hypothetical protein